MASIKAIAEMVATVAQVKTVLIVGGGIAGCSAAIALAQQGMQVTVLEKQPEWKFQSSGIFIYHNGLAALQKLGALDDILREGFAIADGKNIYLDQQGQPIVDTFYPTSSPEIPPIVGIKRAMLHRVLAGRMQALNVDIRLGCSLQSLDNANPESVSVVLSDGSQQQYDLVIGADGLRSQVRGLLFGDLQPRYTGLGVWRSVHARPKDLDVKIMQMGQGKRLGIMPISDETLYIFGTMPEPEGAWYERERWPVLMRERFAEFGGPVQALVNEISASSEVLYTAVEEVSAPLPWHRGRVLIIGDAAHASTPFMGQGGAMAMEDAVALGDLLAQPGEVADLLQAFGQQRYPICQFVQNASRKVGEAGASEDASMLAARNDNMRRFAQQSVDDFYRQLDALRVG